MSGESLFQRMITLMQLVLFLVGCSASGTPAAPTPQTIAAVALTAAAIPTVTSTQALIATPTVMATQTLATLPTGDLVLNQDFKNSSTWWCRKYSSTNSESYCEDGELHLNSKATGVYLTMYDGKFRDFILQAQMRLIGESGSYGVVFRGQGNPLSYYIFRLRSTGQFQLIKRTQNQSQDQILIPWTGSVAINKEQSANQLGVIAQGTQIALVANGEKLTTVANDSLTEGVIGLVASDAGHAVVGGLKVWALPVSNAATTSPLTVTPTLVPLTFELLGVPTSYSPKQTHWSLVDLQLWHDRIYLAHGDWNNNTGPVRAMYLALGTGKFVHDESFVFNEEAIDKFVVVGDTLYAPGTDSTESWDFGNLYYRPWNGKWTKLRTIPRGVHVFDVAVLGKTLFASGVSDSPDLSGIIWTSTDDGQKWKTSLQQLMPGMAGANQVHASFFILDNVLYATTVKEGCFVFGNDAWTKANCLPVGLDAYKNVLYKDTVVMVPFSYGQTIYFFDGKEPWSVAFDANVYDVVSTNGRLFILTGDPFNLRESVAGAIYYASNLNCHCAGDFTRIARFDLSEGKSSNPRGNSPASLEYADGRFYIGFADGRLFRSTPYHP